MFEGTDLNAAYGTLYDAPAAAPAAPPAPIVSTRAEAPKVTAQAVVSHAQPPDVVYAPPQAMYAQQGAAPLQQESFWDRLGQKKWEVMKLFVFALVVLLGIAMDRVANHYLTTYIGSAFLTNMQELLVRLSYPLIIILVLWTIKALA
jgi:hypothetical protein